MTTASHPSRGFQDEVIVVLSRIQDSLAALAATLPVVPSRPQELARVLQLDKSLAWKVHRIMQSHDPFAAARLVPGSAAVAILADAARRHASEEHANAITGAFHAFDGLVERHAGDRGTFDLLVSGFAPDGRREIDVSHRKSAFVGNSAILGLHSKVTNIVTIIQPSTNETRLDMIKVGVIHSLRRLRPDVPTTVWRVRHHETTDRRLLPRRGEPLETPVGVPGTDLNVPLLSRFCSAFPSPLRAVTMPNGLVDIEIPAGEVGDTGSLTIVFAEVYRDIADRYADGDDRFYDVIHRPYIPTETLVQDLLVRRDTFGPIRPELAIYHMFDPALELGAPLPERYRLPMDAPVERVGEGRAFFRSQDLPQYPALLAHVFQAVGWNPAGFELYRVRTPYPIQPSALRIRLELPQPPKPG